MVLSRRFLVVAALGLALVGTQARAQEGTKETDAELLQQQDKQKQIQAETDHLVRRLATMLRVLEF